MESRTKIIRVEKKKGSLGFSIKGGAEHGIPIVVSEIDKNGPSNLHLGDELLYVNEASLQSASHSEAVQKLRSAKGPVVQLRVRPNRILEDTFMSPEKTSKAMQLPPLPIKKTAVTDWWSVPDENPNPLPQGWSRKVDHKSGKPYFENHLTCTTTWTDPRTLLPVTIDRFDWRSLPPGWERFVDQQGDKYYVNHDTQTTHWDCPRGNREQKQLEEVRNYMEKEKVKLKDMVDELTEKRTVLLSRNQLLESLQQRNGEEEEEESNMAGQNDDSLDDELNDKELIEERKEELIEDIMALNDEIDLIDESVKRIRKNTQRINDILWKARGEEIGDVDSFESAEELSLELKQQLTTLKEMEADTYQSIQALEQMRDPKDTPISYILQMTPAKKKKNEDNDTSSSVNWVHLLSDKLTAKTNCEMRIEILVLEGIISHAGQLTRRAMEVCQWVQDTKRGFDWENVTDQLLGMDLLVFNDEWIQADDIREKLDILMKNDTDS